MDYSDFFKVFNDYPELKKFEDKRGHSVSEANIRRRLIRNIKKQHPDVHIYRIQDVPGTGWKPYDFYYLLDGTFHAVEVKDLRGSKTLNINILRTHQVRSLLEVEKNGGVGHVMGRNFDINIKELVKEKRIKLKGGKHGFKTT